MYLIPCRLNTRLYFRWNIRQCLLGHGNKIPVHCKKFVCFTYNVAMLGRNKYFLLVLPSQCMKETYNRLAFFLAITIDETLQICQDIRQFQSNFHASQRQISLLRIRVTGYGTAINTIQALLIGNFKQAFF